MTESYGNCGLAAATRLRMEFSRKLAHLCSARGWDQVELNRHAGEPVSKATVSNYMTGKSKPPADVALAFARALGVDLAWLVDDDADLPARQPTTQSEVLSDDEKLVLRLVRTMGSEQALRRLAALEVRPLSVEQADKLKRELGR